MNRADLLRRGTLLVATGAGFGTLPRTAAAAIPDADLAYLRLLVASELLAADYAAQALSSRTLKTRARGLVTRIGAHDKAHYDALAALVTSAGQVAATAEDIDFSYPAKSFATQGSTLELGWTLARLSLATYVGALQSLQAPEARAPVVQILAGEAQRVSGFASLLGHPLVGPALPPALSIDSASSALDRYES